MGKNGTSLSAYNSAIRRARELKMLLKESWLLLVLKQYITLLLLLLNLGDIEKKVKQTFSSRCLLSWASNWHKSWENGEVFGIAR